MFCTVHFLRHSRDGRTTEELQLPIGVTSCVLCREFRTRWAACKKLSVLPVVFCALSFVHAGQRRSVQPARGR